MAIDFKNKVCIVTGSTSGIGFGIAEELLKRGAEVYVSGRTPEHMEETKEKLAKYGDMVHFQMIDVCHREELEKYITEIGEKRGIDWLFPNAGGGTVDCFEDITWEMWDEILGANEVHVIASIKAALPFMLKQGEGHVVVTSSMAGYCLNPYQSHYVTTKFAVYGLTQSLHYEFAPDNISFQAICPGYVRTNLFERNNLPVPDVCISLEKAVEEIFAGIESGDVTINVSDQARNYYAKVKEDPAWCDQAMARVAATNRVALKPKRG